MELNNTQKDEAGVSAFSDPIFTSPLKMKPTSVSTGNAKRLNLSLKGKWKLYVALFLLLAIPASLTLMFREQIFHSGASSAEEYRYSFTPPVGVNRILNNNQVRPDVATGGKNLFTTWSDHSQSESNDTADIYAGLSKDGGLGWQDGVRLTTTSIKSDDYQPRSSVASADDNHAVVVWDGFPFPQSSSTTDGGSTWKKEGVIDYKVGAPSNTVVVEAKIEGQCFADNCPRIALHINNEPIVTKDEDNSGQFVEIDSQIAQNYTFTLPEGTTISNTDEVGVRVYNVEGLRKVDFRKVDIGNDGKLDAGILDKGTLSDGSFRDCTNTQDLLGTNWVTVWGSEGGEGMLRFNHTCTGLPGNKDDSTTGGAPGYAHQPRIIYADGVYYILSLQVEQEQYGNDATLELFYSKDGGVSWYGGGAELENYPGYYDRSIASFPDVGSNWTSIKPDIAYGGGKLHVTWVDPAAGDIQYMARNVEPNSPWSTKKTVANSNLANPRIMATSDKVFITYESGASATISLAYKDQGASSFLYSTISSGDNSAHNPELTFGFNLLQAYWIENVNGREVLVHSASDDLGATWMTPLIIHSEGEAVESFPAVVMDKDQIAHIVYQLAGSPADQDVYHIALTVLPPENPPPPVTEEPVPVFGSIQVKAKGKASNSGTLPKIKVAVNGVFIKDSEGKDLEQEVTPDSYKIYTFPTPKWPEALDKIDVLFTNSDINLGNNLSGSAILWIDDVFLERLRDSVRIQVENGNGPNGKPIIQDTWGSNSKEFEQVRPTQSYLMMPDLVCSPTHPIPDAPNCESNSIMVWDTGAIRINYDSGTDCVNNTCIFKFDNPGTTACEGKSLGEACSSSGGPGDATSHCVGRYCQSGPGKTGDNNACTGDDGCANYCTKMDVGLPETACTTPRDLGYYWDGDSCELLKGCTCQGSDCGEFFASGAACDGAYANCNPVSQLPDLKVTKIYAYRTLEDARADANVTGEKSLTEAELLNFSGTQIFLRSDLFNAGATGTATGFWNDWKVANAVAKRYYSEPLGPSDRLTGDNIIFAINDLTVGEYLVQFEADVEVPPIPPQQIGKIRERYEDNQNAELRLTVVEGGGKFLRQVCDMSEASPVCIREDLVINPSYIGPECLGSSDSASCCGAMDAQKETVPEVCPTAMWAYWNGSSCVQDGGCCKGNDCSLALRLSTKQQCETFFKNCQVSGIKPDLYAKNIYFVDDLGKTLSQALTTDYLGVGKSVFAKFVLENTASVATGSTFEVHWTIERQVGETMEIRADQTKTHPAMGSNASSVQNDVITVPWEITLDGKYILKVVVDEPNRVAELNENNNSITLEIVIPKFDPEACNASICIKARGDQSSIKPGPAIMELFLDSGYIHGTYDERITGHYVPSSAGRVLRIQVEDNWKVYELDIPGVTPNSRLGVAYINDFYDNPQADRNLYVEWISVGGKKIQSDSAGVYYDLGMYSQDYRVHLTDGPQDSARDCQQVIYGRQKMNVEGMLWFQNRECITNGKQVVLGSIQGKVYIDSRVLANGSNFSIDPAQKGTEVTSPYPGFSAIFDRSSGVFDTQTTMPIIYSNTYTSYLHNLQINPPVGYEVYYRVCPASTDCAGLVKKGPALVTIPANSPTDFSRNVAYVEWFLVPISGVTNTTILPVAVTSACDTCALKSERNFTISPKLVDVLNKAGNAFNVPADILLGVLYHEGNHPTGSHILNFSDAQIEQAVTTGDPYCFRNSLCAAGPFQFATSPTQFTELSTACNPNVIDVWSTMVGASGSTTRTAFNQLIGKPADYQPHPCNLRDSAYAAAVYIKTKSGKENTATCAAWSSDDAWQAWAKYLGNCSGTNATYCQGAKDFLNQVCTSSRY